MLFNNRNSYLSYLSAGRPSVRMPGCKFYKSGSSSSIFLPRVTLNRIFWPTYQGDLHANNIILTDLDLSILTDLGHTNTIGG